MSISREAILVKLRDYQKEAVLAGERSIRGKVILPTGSGKTYCQAAQLALDIDSTVGFRAYVVNAPRIVLTYQLLKEYYEFLSLSGLDLKYMFAHSGSKADEEELEDIRAIANDKGNSIPYGEIVSCITSLGIQEKIQAAKRLNVPILIVSTYHSFNKVRLAFSLEETPINIILNDEAHHLVSDVFHEELTKMEADKILFYTATEKFTSAADGKGMNNKELFGNTLINMTPREAIQRGLMVPPRLHIIKSKIKTSYTEEDYDSSRNRVILEAFEQHREMLNIPAKMIVATSGSQEIKEFISSSQCTTLQERGVHVFAIASREEISNWHNGEQITRQQFLKELKKCGKSEEELIVLHYDILTEGIDISGFTGLMSLRALSRTKFRQLYGRIARRVEEDIVKLKWGKVKYDDFELLKKPVAWVILPDITTDHADNKANIKNLLSEMRHYLINPSDLIVEVKLNGIPETEPIDNLNEQDSSLISVTDILKELEEEIEDLRYASLSEKELIMSLITTN